MDQAECWLNKAWWAVAEIAIEGGASLVNFFDLLTL
jgi:hypothetical protein